MSLKDIKEAIDEGKVYFGIKQAVKHKSSISSIFIAKDARDETVKKLEDANLEFVVLKPKSEMTKLLNLDFESEVFSIKK